MLIYVRLLYCVILCSVINVKSAMNTSEDAAAAALRAKIRNDFDWRAYLELYPDLVSHFSTREEALFHFTKFGRKEGRRFPKIYPNQPSLSYGQKKLNNFITSMDSRNVPVEKRNFVIYFIGALDLKDSLEVGINNVRIFSNAVRQDQEKSTTFYWFNLIGGMDNVLRPYLPLDQANVADAEWMNTPSHTYNHFRTLGIFKHLLETKFSTIVFLNNHVRGPFIHIENGQWINMFSKLLHNENNVGLVGPTLSCEVSPHIQNYAFAIRSEIIPVILQEYSTFRKFDDVRLLHRRYDIGLTELIQRSGYNITSLQYTSRTGLPSFNGYCLPKPADLPDFTSALDPTRWCDIKIEEIVFFLWGGDVLRSGFICERVRQYMVNLLMDYRKTYPSLKLFFPETLKAGALLHLYKEYDHEMWKEAMRVQKPKVIEYDKLHDKICFMVRTCWMHDLKPNRALVDATMDEGIDGIVRCKFFFSFSLFVCFLVISDNFISSFSALLRQTDPNWEAIFFITDDKPFEVRLNEILGKYNDKRIVFFDVPKEYRPAVIYPSLYVFFFFLFFLIYCAFSFHISILRLMLVILPLILSSRNSFKEKTVVGSLPPMRIISTEPSWFPM
jgi:hypothetical protein